MQLFEKLERKDAFGNRKKWKPNEAILRYFEPEIAYINNERTCIDLSIENNELVNTSGML